MALSQESSTNTAATARPTTGRRRSPSNPAETARRAAWGRKWGAITSVIGRQVREGQ